MSNTVTLTLKINDNGDLALVTKEAKKTAAGIKGVDNATKQATKSQNHYNRGAKGVGQAGLSSAKGFSKMRDSMSGSNGLVSAYAILAANIFAATAAFNALRRAAQLEQLEKGLREVGAAAGSNLPDIAAGLKEITGAAVSTEQAMRSTALAISAGFRSDQLQNLTRVAKGASIALGRDMGDALDRLVRGTAKLEPEILDELGIMVRLDDAVQNYADRLGIAVTKMTNFDRRQAFLNATIEQGLEKYEDLSRTIDANPYDKLAASLADLQKRVISWTSSFLGLNKAITFTSKNLGALAAVGTTLVLSITRGIAPGMFRMAEAAAASADQFLKSRVALASVATAGTSLPPKFKLLTNSLQDGTATTEQFAAANRSLTGQLGSLTKGMNRAMRAGEDYQHLEDRIGGVRAQMSDLVHLEAAQRDSNLQNAKAATIGSAANFQLRDSFKSLGETYDLDVEKTTSATKGKKGLRTSLKKLGPAFRTAGTGAKAFGAALFTALPYIGIIISVVSVLYGVIKAKFFPEDLVKKRIDDAVVSFQQFSEITAKFYGSSSKGGKRLAESYIAFAGVLDQISGKIREVSQKNIEGLVTTLGQESEALAGTNRQIASKKILLANLIKANHTYRGARQDIADIEEHILILEGKQQTLETARATMKERIMAMELDSAERILEGALLQLNVQKGVGEAMGVNAFNTELMVKSMAQLTELQQKLKDGKISYLDFLIELELIQRFPNEVRAAFQEVDQLVASFNATMAKRQQKAKILYGEEEDGIQAIIDKFASLTEAAAETKSGVTDIGGMSVAWEISTEGAKEAVKLLEELRKKIKDMKLAKQFLDGEAGLQRFVEWIVKTRTNITTLTNDLAKQKEEFKGMAKAAKGLIGGEGFMDTQRNAMLNKELELIKEKITAEGIVYSGTEAAYKLTENYLKLMETSVKLTEQKISPAIISKKIALDTLKLTVQENKLTKEKLTNTRRINAMKAKAESAGGRLSPKKEFELALAQAKAEVDAAKLTLSYEIAKATLTRELLVLQMDANGVEKPRQEEILALLNAQLDITRRISEEKIRGAKLGVSETIQTGAGTHDTGFERMGGDSAAFGMKAVIKSAENMKAYAGAVTVAAAATQDLNEKEAEKASAQENKTEVFDDPKSTARTKELAATALAEAVAAAEAASLVLTQAQVAVKNSAIQMVSDTLTGMSEALATLGPEGILAASFGNLSNIMLTSVVGALEIMAVAGKDTAMKLSAGFAAAASIIGGIASIMAASSNAAIDAIDKQIAQEKKRDGQSDKSLSKIKGMESKKENIKKKAFETDKKLKIAQAIMATAAGIAQAFSLGPILGPIMMGIVAAMGAAQIAVISGMTYQGGGSLSSAQPQKVAIGQRSSSVDLAKGNNQSGEIGYARGGSGQGGMTDFKPTPAFTGTKYRASGGETAAFMVGEQGPEMFIPERAGRIAPADETATMNNAPTNVNFSIQAIDSAGVEDLLNNQRGNIISMIREAANSHGEFFLESVTDFPQEKQR